MNWREKGRIHLRGTARLCLYSHAMRCFWGKIVAACLLCSLETSVILAAPALAAASMASHANAPLPIMTTSCW